MATAKIKSAGRVGVQAVPITAGFSGELRKELKEIEKTLKVRVDVEVDTDRLKAALDAFQDHYKIKIETVLDGKGFNDGLDRQIRENQKKIKDADYSPDFDTRPWERRWKEVQRITDQAEKQLGKSEADMAKRAELSAKREDLRRKIFFTPVVTPESQAKHLKSLDDLVKELEKKYPVNLRIDVNEKTGQEAVKRVQNSFDSALSRLGSTPEDNKEREKLISDLDEFNRKYKKSLELGSLSNNFKGAAPAMEELISKMDKVGVPLELEPIDKLTIDRYKKEIEARFGTLEANIDPRLNDVDAVRAKLAALRKEAMAGVDKLQADMVLGVSDEHAREKVQRLIHDINGKQIALDVDANVLAASARLREFMNRPRTARIIVDADTKKAAAEIKAMMTALSGVGTANAQLQNMQKLLTNSTTLIPRIGAMSSLIGGIGSAAIGAVGGLASLLKSMESLLGLGGMIPAAFAGGFAMIGTLAAAFKGIGPAVARLAEDKAGGGGVVRNAQVQAVQVAQAQRRTAAAYENASDSISAANERIVETTQAVTDAEREQDQDRLRSLKAVRAAQKAYDKAQNDALGLEDKLSEARAKAVQNIIDVQNALANATISRREAEIEYAKALQAYQSAQGDNSVSSKQMQELELARDKAAQQLKNTQSDEKKAGVEAVKTTKAQVEGSDNVLSAKQAIADAQERIATAAENLNYAEEENSTNAVKYEGRVRNAKLDVVRAEKSKADAIRTSNRAILEAKEAEFLLDVQRTDTASRAEDAMAKLTPEGQRAAKAFLRIQEVMTGVKQIAQENFFKGFTTPMQNMIERLLPQLESGVGNVATVMGSGWGTFFTSMEKALGGGVLATIFNNIADAIGRGNQAIGPLVQAVIDITSVGSTFLPRLADAFAKWATDFAVFIDNAKNDGSLKQWMEDGITGFKQLMNVLKGAYGIFTAIATAAAKGGAMNMGTLGDNLNKFAGIMKDKTFQDAMASVFAGAGDAIDGINVGMKALGDVFAKNGPMIQKIMGGMGTNLGKIITLVAKLLGDPKVMAGIDAFITGIGKGIDRLIEAAPEIAKYVGTMLEIGGKLGELFGAIGAELYKIIGPIMEFLGPILKWLIDVAIQLAPFIAFLIPITKVTGAFKILTFIGPKVLKFFEGLGIGGNKAGKALEWLSKLTENVFPGFSKWIGELGPKMAKWFDDIFLGARTWLKDAPRKMLEGFVEGWRNAWPNVGKAVGDMMQKIRNFFPFSPAKVGPFSGTGYTTYSGDALAGGFAEGIRGGIGNVRNAIASLTGGAKNGFDGAIQNIQGFASDLLDGLGFNGDELVNSGKSLMRGLGEGIRKVSPELYKTVEGVLTNIRKYFPFSPAKLGPFSGTGYTTYSGLALGTDFAEGIKNSYNTVTKASLGLVSAVEMPKSARVNISDIKPVDFQGAIAAQQTYITNNISEAVSAKATAIEANRLQKAKRA